MAVERAVVSRPKLMPADQPAGNLRSTQDGEIVEVFRKPPAEGVAIAQATHWESNAPCGNRIIIILLRWPGLGG